MKKLLVIMVALAVVIPSTSVLALSGKAVGGQACSVTSSCFKYNLGELKNFVVGPTELAELQAGDLSVGQFGVIIEDIGAGSQFVKALTLSPFVSEHKFYDPDMKENGEAPEPMFNLIQDARGELNAKAKDSWEYADRDNGVLKVSFATLDDLKAAFGAEMVSETKYKIEMDRIPKTMKEELEALIIVQNEAEKINDAYTNTLKNGFYTSTFDKEAGYVWVVKFQMSGNTISGMTIEQDDITTDQYAVLPAVYFDKDYDCKQNPTNTEEKENYACYSCGETYTWLEVGKQDPTCELVGDVTQKVKCVKNAKTGVKEYIVEFIGITALCGIALVLAKKKDIFRSI